MTCYRSGMIRVLSSRSRWPAPRSLAPALAAAVVLFCLLLAPLAWAQEGEFQDNVTFDVEMFRVDLYRDAAGETVERFAPVSEASPGAEIEYRVTASNDGDRIYRARELSTTLDLPEGAAYLDGSAGPEGDAYRVRLSADGGSTFEDPAAVNAEDVDAIEWTYLERFEPGDEVTLSYRVTVL